MTYLQIIFNAKKKYSSENRVIFFEILYSISKKVSNIKTFSVNRNKQIDFSKKKYFKLLNDYFIKQKPLDLIIKKTKFYSLDLDIYRGILVPRNETELLVKHSIKLIKKYKIKQIYDLCCGSGNIGLAIKKHASGTNVTCVDMNHSAIENTRHNASKNDVKIKTIIGDFYNSIKSKISCIVCNPPYVNNKKLDKRMLKYEDKISFTNSMDELYFYKKIINNYGKIMKNNFLIIFEIGYDQKKALTKILGKNNLLKYSSFDKDLSGLDRILTIDKY